SGHGARGRTGRRARPAGRAGGRSRLAPGRAAARRADGGAGVSDQTLTRRPAWWFLGQLVAFRPWLHLPNCLSITLLILLETVPGLVAREYLDGLATGGPGLGWLWWPIGLLAGAA